MNDKIDFVILWVDGSDENWQKEFEKYKESSGDRREVRFRDWDNLQYLFRAFEKFTPWVNKIHFVTWGHLPKWLNINHPKLNIIKHEMFMDKSDLPVFNANPLEIYIHNIKDLSDNFVYFNDDFFPTAPISKERFFKDGLPCDSLISNAISSSAGVGHFVLNNLEVINRHFSKKESIKNHYKKWLTPIYRKDLFRNLVLLPWARFTGFVDPHMPQPFLKSTFEEVWEMEEKVLKKTLSSRFRECSNVNQYLFRYWQLAQGKFYPISMKDTQYITMTMKNIKNGEISNLITSQKYKMICLNDSDSIESEAAFEEAKITVQNAFEKILPNKSSFEI